jgi:hypothetical protein
MLVVRDKKFTVNVVLETLKKTQLPIKIPTAKCPNRDAKCKLHHGEYLITKYDRKLDRFFIRSYSVHKDMFLESWFKTGKVKEMFLRCLQNRKFTIPKLLEIIDISYTYRRKVISLRYTDREFKKITRKSRKENLTVNDYIRDKSLS